MSMVSIVLNYTCLTLKIFLVKSVVRWIINIIDSTYLANIQFSFDVGQAKHYSILQFKITESVVL